MRKMYKVPFLPSFWSLLLIALHGFVLYMSSLVLCLCSSILPGQKVWSYKCNLSPDIDACPFVDPFMLLDSSGPWKINH